MQNRIALAISVDWRQRYYITCIASVIKINIAWRCLCHVSWALRMSEQFGEASPYNLEVFR